jgi:hypothetical protein
VKVKLGHDIVKQSKVLLHCVGIDGIHTDMGGGVTASQRKVKLAL